MPTKVIYRLLANQGHKISISFYLGNCESGKEYDSIFVSVPSTSVNFLPVVRLLHPRLLPKLDPTFNFI